MEQIKCKCREEQEFKDLINRLNRIEGQVRGVKNMVEEDRYCIDISQQLMASEAILNKVNKEILTAHLKHCVAQAESAEEREEKVDELVTMLGKIM